jgi:hypothetical protein
LGKGIPIAIPNAIPIGNRQGKIGRKRRSAPKPLGQEVAIDRSCLATVFSRELFLCLLKVLVNSMERDPERTRDLFRLETLLHEFETLTLSLR